MLAAAIRPIFNASDTDEARALLGQTIDRLESPLPEVAAMLLDPEEDLLGFYAFPATHRTKLRSTNPPERANPEIARRTNTVGIFPNDQALTRLAGALLIEQNDEWPITRRYLSEGSMTELLEQNNDKNTKPPKKEATGHVTNADGREPPTPPDATRLDRGPPQRTFGGQPSRGLRASQVVSVMAEREIDLAGLP